MTKATHAKRAGFSEITLTVLPGVEPVERAKPKRGETVRAFVDRMGWEARGLPMVCAMKDGDDLKPLMRSDWSRRIKPSDRIVFLSQPLGGGGGGGGSKQIGAIIAMVAVIALATLVAGPAGFLAGAGFGSTTLAIASALIIAGGSFLISHFMAPKAGGKSKEDDDPLTISLSGNKARPQQPIPVAYGRLKFNPDFSTPPWTDFAGEKQVFHALYTIGAGLYEIEEIGLAGVPVWTIDGGVDPSYPTFKYQIAEPDEEVTLFPTNVAVSPDVTGIELPNPSGGVQYVGPFIVNPPGSIGQEVAVDIVFPGGLYAVTDDGDELAATTGISVQYRMIDDTGVPAGPSWIAALSKSYTMRSKVPVRRTERFTLPTAGRVQLRMGRTTEMFTSNGANTIAWVGARLYLRGPNARPKVTQLAIELESDKSLTSFNSQQIYVIATRRIPVWTGTTWETQPTQNPVWAAVDMWHDPDYGGNQTRDKIDLPLFAQKADEADARGDTFNHRFISESTVLDALTTIFRSMLAQPVYVWDRLSMVRDEERELPRVLLTDFEIIRGTPSLSYTLQDTESSDGTIVEYLEEETWSRADVGSAPELSDLVHPARVKVEGVTNRRQATVIARYLAAVNRYRRTVLSLDVEAEGKLLKRGDLVAVQTEMPGTYGEGFRVDNYNVTSRTLTFHAPATWAVSGNHYIYLKGADGAAFGPVKVTKGVSDNVAIIDATDLALVESQQGVTLSVVLARSDVSERPSAAFGAGAPRVFYGLVTRIGNAGDGRFTLDLANDAPEVYEIDDSAIPALPTGPVLGTPETPSVVEGLYATLTQSGLVLTLSAAWQPASGAQSYTAQTSLDEGETWTTVYPGGYEPSFQITGFGDADILLRVRGVSANGVTGPWTQVELISPGITKTTDALGISLSPESVNAAAFASSIQPVRVVDTNPNPVGYTGLPVIYNTTDGKLYHYEDGDWAAGGGSDFSDMTGQIVSTQITPGAVTTPALAANAVSADKLAANSVIAGKIAAGAVTATAISVGTLSAISADMGTVTAGQLQGPTGKFLLQLTDGYLLVSD